MYAALFHQATLGLVRRTYFIIHESMQTRYLWRALGFSIVVLGLARPTFAAGPATSITVSPSTATITSDQSVTFAVIATDAQGAATTVTGDSTISTDDPLGSIEGTVYNAGKVGQWTIQINYQSLKTTATVTVTPGALAEIDVNPDSQPEVVVLGKFRTFKAKGFDQHNNVVTDFSPTWVVSGSIGSIDEKGKFTATAVGTGTVEARSATGVIDQVAVTVREPAPESTTNTNTNVAPTNKNTNTANTNTAPTNANANTNTSTAPISNDAISCTTLKNSVWVLIVVGYLALVALLFAFIPVTKIWPALIALGGAIALVFVHRAYACSVLPWWPWVLTLGTVGLTMLALRQSPKKM